MKVLVVGSGGREHAMAWKIAQSPRLRHLYIAPGNAGTMAVGENVPVAADDVEGLAQFAGTNGIDLTVVGPEVPLSSGLVDRLNEAGLLAFGPTRAAAMLEASKVWSKEFMRRNGIPTAGFRAFDSLDGARDYVTGGSGPIVVKADGLAAGKGVTICQDRDEAWRTLEDLMGHGSLGPAGRRVVVEELLQGREVSFLAFSDGERVVPMPPVRDHKKAYDGDRGPNTGGMGAYSPLPDWSEDLERRLTSIMEATVRGMAQEGVPFRGVLYGGFILTPQGPFTLEFNVRFGDPETQALLPRLRSDLLDILEAAARGDLDNACPEWDERSSVCVVAASRGYPGHYEKGKPIQGVGGPFLPGVEVFHAGTAPGPVTAGGRVLGVTALGHGLKDARERAYEALSRISFEGMVYRRDIGSS
ncbi:MAG: phosphoribosylamine--glycine ligase [Bacillota bacterium]